MSKAKEFLDTIDSIGENKINLESSEFKSIFDKYGFKHSGYAGMGAIFAKGHYDIEASEDDDGNTTMWSLADYTNKEDPKLIASGHTAKELEDALSKLPESKNEAESKKTKHDSESVGKLIGSFHDNSISKLMDVFEAMEAAGFGFTDEEKTELAKEINSIYHKLINKNIAAKATGK